ncbi:MAG: septum formation protein Maf [Sedimentisphaerales bacterium]|nr:septum formation protein Maf [Sedimentisphaerales bacterium]
MNPETKIILASASPRRKDLMQKEGYQFDVVVSNVAESDFPVYDMAPAEYAKTLALAKAKDVAKDYPDAVVIGADTIADCDGRIIGKAEDEKDAERITRLLFSKPHKIITGLAIIRLSDDLEIVKADTTIVYPRKMTDAQIARHIKGGTWAGKAGAYAIQETGDEFVEHIEGSLTNVMGLPMELLNKLLTE